MIELSDGNIALSSRDVPYPIVIIDTSSYQVKKEIQLKDSITGCSSLCVFDEHSFIYVYEGTFLQISNKDGSVLFHSERGSFNGCNGILPLEEGKYFAIENKSKISIIKPWKSCSSSHKDTTMNTAKLLNIMYVIITVL